MDGILCYTSVVAMHPKPQGDTIKCHSGQGVRRRQRRMVEERLSKTLNLIKIFFDLFPIKTIFASNYF